MSFNLRDALDDVVGLLARKAEEKSLALRLEVAAGTEQEVEADPARLKQVLVNLVGNAIKFTQTGSVTIKVASHADSSTSEGSIGLRFSIVDTGIGVSEEARGRLFQKFTQADTSTTRRYGGTGLGLAICRQLVEKMGGTIHVQSEEGHGSTFWFDLPVKRVEAPTPASVSHEEQRSAAATTVDARVLLAEDNPVNQKLAVHLLKKLGCRVDVAGNGVEALEMVSRLPYDLVFMDCHMPEMDGFEATREIRRRESEQGVRHTPIVALTASVLQEDRERCAAAGMEGFAGKPLRPAELADYVRRFAPSERPAAE